MKRFFSKKKDPDSLKANKNNLPRMATAMSDIRSLRARPNLSSNKKGRLKSLPFIHNK